MGSEFVTRKSSVWGKKSKTKPSLFTPRPFSVPTREDNTVSKKELPKDIPPANYITDKIGRGFPQPAIQREEDSQDKESEQETDINAKSDVSADDDENKVNLKADKSIDIPPANYITDKIGRGFPQPAIQREEDSQEKESEQETDINAKSDVSADDDENKEENINLKPQPAFPYSNLPIIQRQDTDSSPEIPNHQLTPPSLLQPPEPSSRYNLRQDSQLKLDPEIFTMAAELIQQQMETAAIRAAIRAGLSQVSLAPPKPASLRPRPQSRPLVPLGKDPNTPLPTLNSAIANSKTQLLKKLRRNWRKLSIGGQVGTVSSVVVIGSSVLAGVLADPSARKFALSQFNGRVIPVPGLDWLHVEINTEGNNLMMGLHLDVGSLLPKILGFGSSSPQAIGAPPSPKPVVPAQSTLQRKEVEEEHELESIQTKLTVGKPGDKYEQEADATATKIMGMSDETLQRQSQEETEDIQTQQIPTLNTAPTTEKEEPEAIQTKGKGNKTQPSSSLESRLGSSKGGGSHLPDAVRGFMEPRFGADFSNVRVHNDSGAVQMNKELGAQAFAHGNDIYYGAGKSPGNNELTAHELTHTIQQTGGKLQPKLINQKIKKENKVQPKTVFPVQMKQVPVEGEVERVSPDSVENPQKEQQAGSAVNNEKEQKKSTSPQNKDSKAPQKNAAVTGKNPTSPQETTEDKAEKSPKEETNAAANSGDNSQTNQQTTTPETTSEKTAPASPESDPDFQAVVDKASTVANKEKKHEPANQKSQEAQDAAQSPASEVESKAQGNQVGEMEKAPTPAFNGAAFKAKLMERIKEAAPKNLDEADNFKDNNKLGAVKSEMQDKVKQEQTASQTPLAEKAKQAPDTSGIEPKSVTPLPPNQVGTPTQNINAQKAIPKAKGQGEVETPLQQSSQKLDEQMADANVTDEQLAKSNEPQFQTALAAKQETKTNANQAPQQYRQFEQNQLTQAQGEASATAQQQLQGMHGSRSQLLSQVSNQQVQAKGSDEQERTKIAGDIQNIYQQTKTKVETTLNGLDSKVAQDFDNGAVEAQKAFEDYVDKRMEAYKDERYSGLDGKGRWIKDLFLDLPSEVNVFYEQGRQLYLKQMDVVLDKVVNIIGTALTNAKAEIANGRKRIQQYVTKLPQNLKNIGQQAATDIQSQFDQLEQSVDSKQDELINNLAQKYNEKLQTVDSRIEELKAANQGLVSKATNAMTGVINTINKLKEMLLSVLSKAAGVIGNIIQDPIGFLGNLISGIKQGFENFAGNITNHLQSGLIGWLTGTLGPMGIQLPDDIFSLPGIFSLTTQVLGLTFNHIRGKAVKRFGEPVVTGMEQSVEVFQVLRDEGAMGLWSQVQEQFSDLKETVIGEIKNMVITQVITAGVKWIIGLLNPASAFVKAAMAIYDIIMFFVNRGSQVLELVNAVVDAVAKIASGAVGGAAKLVENALSRALPVVIGFMASLLGVGGLAKKVEKIIGRIRERIDKAIDKILLKAKKLFKGKKRKGNKEEGKITPADKKKHEKYLTEIAESLTQEKKTEEESFEKFANRKKKAADKLKKHYQKKLKKGIKITTDYKKFAEEQKYGNFKINFKIHPNDSEKVIDIPYVEEQIDDKEALKTQIQELLDNVITPDYLKKLTVATEESALAMRPRYDNFQKKVIDFLSEFDREHEKKPNATVEEANELLKKIKILKTVKAILIDFSNIHNANENYGKDLTPTDTKNGQSVEQDLASRNKIFGKYSDITWDEKNEVILKEKQFIAISGKFLGQKPRSAVANAQNIGNRKAQENEVLANARNIARKYKDILILVPDDIPEDPYRNQKFDDKDGNEVSINVDNSAGIQDAERKFYGYLYNQIKKQLSTRMAISENKIEEIKQNAGDEFEKLWQDEGQVWQDVNSKLANIPEDKKEEVREKIKKQRKSSFIDTKIEEERQNSIVNAQDSFFEENRKKVSGTVELFSEMTPCDVCQSVDKLVSKWFTGIKVNISFGVDYP